MKQSKKKLIAILAMATMSVTALSSGIAGLNAPVQNAVAETVPERPAVTYIEDVVDKTNDVRNMFAMGAGENLGFGYLNSAGKYVKGEWNTLNTVAQSGTATIEWASYNTATPAVKDTVYYYDGTTKTTKTQTNLNVNGNVIDGNFSYYANAYTTAEPTTATPLPYQWLRIQSMEDKDAILSLNINWTGRTTYFCSRTIGDNNKYIYDTGSGSRIGKYYFELGHNDNRFVSLRTINSANLQVGVGLKAIPKNDLVAAFIARYPDVLTAEETASYNKNNALQYFDRMLSLNDVLTVTYGAYDGDTDGDGRDDATFVYAKLYNATKEKLILEETTVQTTLDDTDYTNNTPRMAIAIHPNQTGTQTTAYDRTPVWIGGVNEPLLAPNKDTTMTAKRGTKLSDLQLPEGYSLASGVDGNQAIAIGENQIAAVCAFEKLGLKNADGNVATSYFGTTSVPCTITVTGEQPDPCTITIKDVNGNTVATDTASIGEEYTIPAMTGRGKTFVAYKVGETLMDVGDTFVPETSTLEVTLLETDFVLSENASVRMAQTEKGYGGIRWTSQMSTTDFESVKDAVLWTATVAPTDAPEDAVTKTFETADFVADGDNTIGYCTITNIQRHNYNRSFTATVKLTVTYADGDTKDVVIETQTACVYDLAVEAYGNHLRQLTIDSVGLYNSKNIAILQQYINGVLDLQYDGAVVSVSEADGLNMAKAYVLVNENGESIDNVTATEQDGTYTATLRFKMNGAAPSAEDNVPVILRSGASVSWTAVSKDGMTRSYDVTTDILTVTVAWMVKA